MYVEYNSNNILKIEHISSHIYLRIKGKKDGKVTFVLKNVCFCYFSIPFFLHCIGNMRFSCINKVLCVCILIAIDFKSRINRHLLIVGSF